MNRTYPEAVEEFQTLAGVLYRRENSATILLF
jgi:hypothetical protein